MKTENKFKIRKAKESDIKQIKKLQEENHYSNVSDEEKKKEGFVSVRTDVKLLGGINIELGIIVAVKGVIVVGYAIPLSLKHCEEIPLLEPFITRILELIYKNEKLSKYKIIIYGQICVKKGYRGGGIAEAMNVKLSNMLRKNFDLAVTEISDQNPRSLHFTTKKLGFEVIDEYSAEGRSWYVLVKDSRGGEK